MAPLCAAPPTALLPAALPPVAPELALGPSCEERPPHPMALAAASKAMPSAKCTTPRDGRISRSIGQEHASAARSAADRENPPLCRGEGLPNRSLIAPGRVAVMASDEALRRAAGRLSRLRSWLERNLTDVNEAIDDRRKPLTSCDEPTPVFRHAALLPSGSRVPSLRRRAPSVPTASSTLEVAKVAMNAYRAASDLQK
jgi:hypothetical protein